MSRPALPHALVSSVIAQLRETSSELEVESMRTLGMTMLQFEKVSHATEQAALALLEGINYSVGVWRAPLHGHWE